MESSLTKAISKFKQEGVTKRETERHAEKEEKNGRFLSEISPGAKSYISVPISAFFSVSPLRTYRRNGAGSPSSVNRFLITPRRVFNGRGVLLYGGGKRCELYDLASHVCLVLCTLNIICPL